MLGESMATSAIDRGDDSDEDWVAGFSQSRKEEGLGCDESTTEMRGSIFKFYECDQSRRRGLSLGCEFQTFSRSSLEEGGRSGLGCDDADESTVTDLRYESSSSAFGSNEERLN
ncbi:hypothetical protein F0562_018397 [Nyssa sinensis]|uniref:Uncharacterized protein n=1 Tax=Nyssa sinensis TaxID=561372 RepID=A0A5J4ZCF1_9ASTE|nr:hypothetical protein F0562_018397 [Nyssa sinensis]